MGERKGTRIWVLSRPTCALRNALAVKSVVNIMLLFESKGDLSIGWILTPYLLQFVNSGRTSLRRPTAILDPMPFPSNA